MGKNIIFLFLTVLGLGFFNLALGDESEKDVKKTGEMTVAELAKVFGVTFAELVEANPIITKYRIEKLPDKLKIINPATNSVFTVNYVRTPEVGMSNDQPQKSELVEDEKIPGPSDELPESSSAGLTLSDTIWIIALVTVLFTLFTVGRMFVRQLGFFGKKDCFETVDDEGLDVEIEVTSPSDDVVVDVVDEVVDDVVDDYFDVDYVDYNNSALIDIDQLMSAIEKEGTSHLLTADSHGVKCLGYDGEVKEDYIDNLPEVICLGYDGDAGSSNEEVEDSGKIFSKRKKLLFNIIRQKSNFCPTENEVVVGFMSKRSSNGKVIAHFQVLAEKIGGKFLLGDKEFDSIDSLKVFARNQIKFFFKLEEVKLDQLSKKLKDWSDGGKIIRVKKN